MIQSEHRQQNEHQNVPGEEAAEQHYSEEEERSDVIVNVEATVTHYRQADDDNASLSSTNTLDSDDLVVEPFDEHGLSPALQQINGLPFLSDSSKYELRNFNVQESTVTIGPKYVFHGDTTIVVNNGNEKKNEDAAAPAENVGTEKDFSFNGSATTEGHKLFTNSANPFFPFSQNKAAEWFWTRRCTIAICVTVLVLLLVIFLSVWLTSKGTKPPSPASPNDTSINNDPTITGVRIVPRIEWGAQPPVEPAETLKILPPTYVIISHTATTFCYTQAQCVLQVRVAQTFHIESKGWSDIAYNFLVGGDGLVYEGRGWDVEGAHTFNYNYMSIGISFIGTFNQQEPTKAQLYAAKKLIEYGVKQGKIAKDFKLLGHRQCMKTESPGQALYDIIRTWDHWSPTP